MCRDHGARLRGLCHGARLGPRAPDQRPQPRLGNEEPELREARSNRGPAVFSSLVSPDFYCAKPTVSTDPVFHDALQVPEDGADLALQEVRKAARRVLVQQVDVGARVLYHLMTEERVQDAHVVRA